MLWTEDSFISNTEYYAVNYDTKHIKRVDIPIVKYFPFRYMQYAFPTLLQKEILEYK